METLRHQELSVTAAVTGGIDSNGMCPGDPSSYCEHNGFYEMLPPGTINIFVYINQNLTDAAIGRALMLCSEAKAAAVSHLLLGSCYSEEIATGSGTDGTVIAFQTRRAYRQNSQHCSHTGTSETDRSQRCKAVPGTYPNCQIWNHPRYHVGFL